MSDHSISDGASPGAGPDPVVQGTDIAKHWGATAVLDGANFTVHRGITGLLGTNGAGKTTLLGMMLGLHRPNRGQLLVLGLDPVRSGPAIRERVGYSPEHHILPPDTVALDLVRHIAEIHGLPHREATGRASDALWQVGLGEERFRPIGTMSTGQRQRVKLAQAIAHDPHLVLLDEPTDGLDPVQRDDMLSLIRRIGTEFGIDIILSSHLLEEVERVCDSAVILAGGRVVANGPIADLTGADRGLLVEVDDRADDLAALLRRRDLVVEVTGNRLVITRPAPVAGGEDDLYTHVRDDLVASGAGLRRLTNRTVSLEDVFLEVGT
jgi:ABC-2 type transport system ATP-binding protein